MRITRKNLQRIIKEEKAKLLQESPIPLRSRASREFADAIKGRHINEVSQSKLEALNDVVWDIASEMIEAGREPEGVIAMLVDEVTGAVEQVAGSAMTAGPPRDQEFITLRDPEYGR